MHGVRLVRTPATKTSPVATTGLDESWLAIPSNDMRQIYRLSRARIVDFCAMSKVRFGMRLLIGAALLIGGRASAQSSNPLSGLDDYISSAMKDWKIPGVAVGIVHGDTVVFSKGFGVRTVGRPEKVDEHTLFALASDSKAFTGILTAMLVDEGKLRWDAPLTTYLPTLKFGDD